MDEEELERIMNRITKYAHTCKVGYGVFRHTIKNILKEELGVNDNKQDYPVSGRVNDYDF